MNKSKVVKIKGKFYDLSTKNKSFLQVAQDLQTSGIKNYYFMLEICDPSLVGIDPHDESKLTKDLINRIIVEIAKNPWYYLRECCRLVEQGGLSMPFSAHKANMAQIWCTINGIDNWTCISRQKGKTQSAIAVQAWAYSFGTNNSQFIFLNKTGDDAKTNLKRLTDQIGLLPSYLQFKYLIDSETGKKVVGIDNATKLQHPITKNEIIVKGMASSKDKASSIGRGLTANVEHFDEVEFMPYVKTIVENSAPTYVKAAENARRNGAFHCRIFTSTPGDLDSQAGEDAALLLEQTTRWSDTMYDKTVEEVREYLKQNSESDIFYIEYNYRDLRETEEWFETQARKIGNPITVKREILLMRIRGSDNSPFDQDALEYIHSKIRPIKSELILQTYYKIDIYENLDRSIPYIIGTDCSTGTNKDHNAFTVINPYTVEPVAEFQCNYIGETKYLALIEEFITKHIPRSILCIERNSVGDAIIDNIIENNRPILNNLYYDRAKDLVSKNINANTTVESMLKARAEEKSYYGVYTSGPSREAMMAILANHVSEHKSKFVTRHITSDLLKLVVSSSGKIQARSGHTDDNIMSYLIGLYVFYHGNNLPLFGFIRGSNVIEEANNSGLHRSVTDYDSDLLPDDVREAMIREEEFNKEISDDEMSRLLLEAQRQTRALAEKGLIKNDPYRGLPDEYRGDSDSSYNDLAMDFLDELNDW